MIYQSFDNTPTNYKQEVLEIVFDLGDDKQENLKVYLDSNPTQLANDFVKQHSLREDAIPVIEETIWNNLQQAFNESASQGGSVQQQQSYQQQRSSNIFDRLHNEAQVKAQRKQKQFIQNTLQQSNRSFQQKKGNPHICEDLYKRCIEQKMKNEKLRESRQLEQNSQQNFSFRPFVSERSQQLAKRPDGPMGDYLLWKGKESNHRKDLMRSSKLIMDQQECSFKPYINDISQKISFQKSRHNPNRIEIHERLYQDGIQSMKKRKNSAQMSYQQSQINSSQDRSQATLKKNGEIPFLERMQISILERQKRQDYIHKTEQQQQSLDSTTGQRLFHPSIGRPPQIERNNENLPIGDYLYQQRIVQDEHHQSLMLQDLQERSKQRARSSDRSNEIYENRKRRQLLEIFEALDSNGDGLISASQIEISGLNAQILQLLAPLLCEMEQIQAELNFEQFYLATSRLLQTLPVIDRDKLLNGMRQKRVVDVEQCTFQPSLNKNSLKMVTTRTHHQKSNRDLIIKQMEEQEMSECTFKPRLISPMRIYDFMLNIHD